MQRYQCHKIVEAAEIVEIDEQPDGSAILTLDENESHGAPLRVHVLDRLVLSMQRVYTTDGDLGYFVRYADGYESWSPTTAFEAGYTRVVLVGFTADQLRELTAIATADPGTVEDIHNRWFHQQVTDGWHFGNTATAAHVSSYLRVFHELAPEQQGLLVHELSEVAVVPDGRRRLAATGGDLPDDFETN